MPGNIFPSTQMTWMGEQLQRGVVGRAELNNHVMSVYEEPLRIYFHGTSWRNIGDAKDVVAGFFHKRLGNDTFITRWQASGLRFRRWLMNAFCFYLRELAAAQTRGLKYRSLPEDQVSSSPSPEDTIDRAFAISIVRHALTRARDDCTSRKLQDHFGVFMQHRYYGRPYEDVAPEFGVDAARAAVMARTATRRFVAALRDLIARDGVPLDEIDDEIRRLLEDYGS